MPLQSIKILAVLQLSKKQFNEAGASRFGSGWANSVFPFMINLKENLEVAGAIADEPIIACGYLQTWQINSFSINRE